MVLASKAYARAKMYFNLLLLLLLLMLTQLFYEKAKQWFSFTHTTAPRH